MLIVSFMAKTLTTYHSSYSTGDHDDAPRFLQLQNHHYYYGELDKEDTYSILC